MQLNHKSFYGSIHIVKKQCYKNTPFLGDKNMKKGLLLSMVLLAVALVLPGCSHKNRNGKSKTKTTKVSKTTRQVRSGGKKGSTYKKTTKRKADQGMNVIEQKTETRTSTQAPY